MKLKLLFLLYGLEVFVLSSCSNEDYFLFYDENWTDIQVPRGRMTKSNPEPQPNYTYPTVSQIASSSIVQGQMNNAWGRMKSSCSSYGRREYAFWIYYHHANDSFWCGEIKEGELFDYTVGEGASVSMPKNVNNIEVCAFFHTHTSLEFAPDGLSRVTGPSPGDISYANGAGGVPGLLYDYSDSVIYSGDSRNNSFQLYTFGPSQRASW